MSLSRKTRKPRKPLQRKSWIKRGAKRIAKVNPTKRKKLRDRNHAYYASAEWREKKRAVHARDGFRCTEIIGPASPLYEGLRQRCPNHGEVVNGKQTARGLVAEEVSYSHRGVPGRIDCIRTRCRDCDRRLTPLERVNHRYGFQRSSGRGTA